MIALFAHRSHRQVEMTAGPLLPNVLAFAVPLILSGMLQLLYNSADIIVVGRFADSVAMASVGATTSLIHLLVSLLMGLSVGASVARRPVRPAPATGTACTARCIPPWRWRCSPARRWACCCSSSPVRCSK